jgi:hypothetical protein
LDSKANMSSRLGERAGTQASINTDISHEIIAPVVFVSPPTRVTIAGPTFALPLPGSQASLSDGMSVLLRVK